MKVSLSPRHIAHAHINVTDEPAYGLDEEKSPVKSSQVELVDDTGHQVPTEEELRSLPRVADELP